MTYYGGKELAAAFRTVLKISAENWEYGRLTFVLPSGREVTVEGDKPGPDARLIVNDFRFLSRVLSAGDIGFGEGFMAGEWDTPDLSALLEAFTANIDRLTRLFEATSSSGRSTSCSTASTATTGAAPSATSWPTTTWATSSTAAGSTPA